MTPPAFDRAITIVEPAGAATMVWCAWPAELGLTTGLAYSQKLFLSDDGCAKMWIALPLMTERR
jgi:hypothetical protein